MIDGAGVPSFPPALHTVRLALCLTAMWYVYATHNNGVLLFKKNNREVPLLGLIKMMCTRFM